jgi:rhamnogalacturonyl hydrolase YesR
VESWVGGGGFIFRIDDPLGPGGARAGVNPNLLVDVVASDCTHHMVVLAGLTTRHPEMKRRLLERPGDRMLEELKGDLLERMRTFSHWGEYNLHSWKAAKALVDTGRHPEVRPAMIASIRSMVSSIDRPAHFDRIAGYFGLAWLADQTGERAGLERARGYLDEVLRRRPRLDGVLTGTGYVDDPLGFGFAKDDQASMYMNNTTVERDVVSTDSLHMYSAPLASMSRATGDPKYLAEALRLAAHVARYHFRPTGALAQVTRRGKLATAAWGRGESHALYGVLYILEEMTPAHAEFARLVAFLRRAGEALRKYQDPETGLWRNVVDNPAARRESSSSIGIAYVYARAIREGWVERAAYEPMVRRAWEGLKQLYWRGGMAANCRGSAYGLDDAYYLERPQGWAKMPHMLLAATEMARLAAGQSRGGSRG